MVTWLGGSRQRSTMPLEPGDDDAFAPPVEARDVLAFRRSLFPGRTLLAQAEIGYVSLIALGIVALALWGIWGTVGSFFLDLASPYHLVWGAPAVLLILLGILRYSTWQGFVSFSEADCMFLLTAPVPRQGLVWPRLRSASLILGVGGAIVAVLASIASGRHALSATRIIEAAVAGFALGVGLVATSWQVQRLARASMWVLRLTVPALAIAVLLALGEKAGGTARLVALWSGPWGWGLLPSGTRTLPYGLAGLLLLCALAVAGWMGLKRTAGACSLESFGFRARTRSRAVAGLYSFDARALVLASRQSQAAARRARFHLAAPRSRWLTVPSRALLALLRSPLRLAWSLLLGGGAMLLLTATPSRTGTVWGGALALYLAAGSLLEPLRLEVDSPAVSQVLLPWRFGEILWFHCLLPVGILIAAGMTTAAAGWAAGLVTARALAVLAVLVVPMTFAVVLAAALSARRGGRVPTQLVLATAGDSTGLSLFGIVAWVFAWAVLALVLVAVSVRLLARAGSPFSGAALAALGFAVLAALLQRLLLASRRR